MADYYRESAWIPDVEIKAPKSSRGYYMNSYLPSTWNRAYLTPTHWRHLALDSKTWGPEIDNERYLAAFRPLKIDRQELHRRLARRWSIVAELNAKGAALHRSGARGRTLAGVPGGSEVPQRAVPGLSAFYRSAGRLSRRDEPVSHAVGRAAEDCGPV